MENKYLCGKLVTVLLCAVALGSSDPPVVPPDTSWQMTHRQPASFVGELYDAGTSLRNVNNYQGYSILAAVAGVAVYALCRSVSSSSPDSADGAQIVLTTLAVGIEVVSVVYAVKAWLGTLEAGNHLHRAAVGWAQSDSTRR